MAEQTIKDVQDAINVIEECLDGKNLLEIKVLKNGIKTLQLEHKIEILENENKLLKMKTNDVEEETTPLNMMSTEDLLTDGIEKFFLKGNPQYSYKRWFDVMKIRLIKNNPCIFEKYLLVKVTCLNPKGIFYFTPFNKNNFSNNQTQLDIFNKGWRHESTTVTILHPNHVNGLTMKKGDKGSNYHHWTVDYVPDNYIDEDGYFIIFGWKK